MLVPSIILGILSSAALAQAYAPFTTSLSLGARGAAVSELQTIMTHEQVYHGPITGYFGLLTRSGVKALQAKYGLDTAGNVGPKTRALLNRLLASSSEVSTSVSATGATHTVIVPAVQNSKPLMSSAAGVAAVVSSTSVKNKNLWFEQNIATTTPSSTSTRTLPTSTLASSTASIRTPGTLGMEWGMYVGIGSIGLATIPSTLGKQPNIIATFVGWPDSFPANFGSTCAHGQTLLVFWENYGYSLDDIISGSNDAYIKSFADDAAKNACPVMVAPFHEMNGNWDAWDGTVGSNTPAKLVIAWRHIHDIFAAAHTSNVKFAWAMNADSVPDVAGNQFSDYYPGDTYVDYVGVDGFNFGNPWQSFGQVFDGAIAKMQTYNKPIYIFSMGSVAGTQKAAWLTEGLGSHVKSYANLKGWVYFNENGSGSNWLINSDSASLAAFKAILP